MGVQLMLSSSPGSMSRVAMAVMANVFSENFAKMLSRVS